jgi:putative DNA primase/helicase
MQCEDIKFIVSKGWAITPVNYINESGLCSCLSYRDECTCQGKHAAMGAWQKNIITNISDIKTIWNDKCWFKYTNKAGESKSLKGNSNYNVGLLTGKINNILVVDIDQHGVDGEDSLKDLETKLGPIGETVESLTGGGGRQLFFKYPKGYSIKNGVGIAPGIDIRSNDGYVLIEPSVTTKAYAWNVERHPEDMEMLELPQAWIDYILQPKGVNKLLDSEFKSKKYKSGGRNNCLFKLGSSYRANGMSDKALLNTLIIENQERCEPPLADEEVQVIVNSIISYEIGDIDIKEIEEEEPKIHVPDVSHFGKLPNGIITELVDFYMQCTDSERDFIIAASIHAVSVALGKKISLDFGNGSIYPLLYQTIIAKSGFMRKSTALNLTKNILKATNNSDLIASDMSSIETFIEILAGSPTKLIIKNEMSELLLSFEKSYMRGAKEFFIDIYDLPNRIVKNRKNAKGDIKKITVNDPYVSIFGASVEETFMQFLNENDMLGGFLPRFLYVVCRKRTREIIHYPDAHKDFPPNILLAFKKLQNIKCAPLNLKESPKAYKMYADWCDKIYEDTTKSNNLTLESFATRYSIILLKFALIFEAIKRVNENRDTMVEISAESMGWAINFMDVYWTNAKSLVLGGNFTFTQYDKERKKVIDILISSKDKTTTRRDLLRKMHMTLEYLKPILDTLKESGEIEEFDIGKAKFVKYID